MPKLKVPNCTNCGRELNATLHERKHPEWGLCGSCEVDKEHGMKMAGYIEIAVITKAEDEDGNHYDCIYGDLTKPKSLNSHPVMVFELGEILILNDLGREITGRGRKPSKWEVEYETFPATTDGLTKAILRAQEVVNA